MLRDLFKKSAAVKYGAIVDIGSGSVGVAIVKSDDSKDSPEVLWSHRERTIIPKRYDRQSAAKHVQASILSAFLELGNAGVRSLLREDSKARVKEVQVSLSAPWCYTITDTISTKFPKSTKISKKILKEVIEKAKAKAEELLNETIKDELDAEPISMSVIDVSLNGYHVSEPEDKEAEHMTLSIVRAFCDKQLLTAIEDASDKVFPEVRLSLNSFTYTYYESLRNLASDTSEVCLIDVTYEATELGIVREGVLEHVTHIPFGSSALVREISELTKTPLEESSSYLRGSGIDITKPMNEARKEDFVKIINSFEAKLADLLRQTGDQLSIPKTIFLHTDALTSVFFAERVKNAAKSATNCNHNLHTVTKQYFSGISAKDTALLVSAYVFHKNLDETRRLAE